MKIKTLQLNVSAVTGVALGQKLQKNTKIA